MVKKGNAMMTKAIIFDKDGTLLDFDALWLAVSDKAIAEILERADAPAFLAGEILAGFGVTDGTVDVDGVLCGGTYGQMAEIVGRVLQKHGRIRTPEQVKKYTVDAYHRHFTAGVVKPICAELSDTLKTLKERGVLLAVVTSDDRVNAERCLDELGITQYFDEIYADDGTFPVKPDPACIDELCRKYGLSKTEVVVVGDTLTDMRFAENGGVRAVGIAKTARNAAVLRAATDTVVEDPSHLLDILF